MNKNKNLFDLAMGWYRSGDSGKKAAALDLFPEDMFKKEIEAYRKRDKEERVKLREENLQKMLKRCQKLFHIGDLIQSPDGTDHLPNLIISEPRIQKVDFLPFCVEDSWDYGPDEKYTIVVDTVRLYMNKPLNRKSKVCLEALLYYMDKSKDDEFRKIGFIDLKEYAKKQIEEKNKELNDLRAREQRVQKDLSDIQMDITTLEEYDPNELTSKKIKEILKNVTKNN
jgi:cob(I)alamin adenosyltransferase